jgi:hypothetical protein
MKPALPFFSTGKRDAVRAVAGMVVRKSKSRNNDFIARLDAGS